MWTDKGFNLENYNKTPGVAVVVGRYMINQLHPGHLHVLNEANKFTNLVILLGCASFPLTKKNSLDFVTRKQMLQTAFPNAVILPIYDKKSDLVWSKQLDSIVRNIFPFSKVSVIGSRDSFLSHYYGAFSKIYVEALPELNATSTRELIGSQPIDSPVFRAGIIYASQHQHPRVQPTVDIGIYRKVGSSYQILLGRKKDSTDYCMPGGFVDIRDYSLAQAATRETKEETGLSFYDLNLKFITSTIINDWRSQPDCKILTTLFAAQWEKKSGIARAGDDLEEVKWFSTKQAEMKITSAHVYLLNCLFQHLKVKS